MGIPLKKLFETVGTWRGFFEPSTATVEIKRERVLEGGTPMRLRCQKIRGEADVIKKIENCQ